MSYRYSIVLSGVISVLLLSSGSLDAFMIPATHTVEYRTNSNTAIDWTARRIYTGISIPAPSDSLRMHRHKPSLQALVLQKAAERCFQAFLDLNLDSSSRLLSVLMRDERLYSVLQQQITPLIRIDTPPYREGNRFKAVLTLPLLSPGNSLLIPLGKLYPHFRLIPEPSRLVTAGYNYSGVVLDVRHLSFKPALGTRILSEDGRIIYDPSRVLRSIFNRSGHMLFIASLQAPEIPVRAGKKFLYLQPLRLQGSAGTDIIISTEDADKMLASKITREALKTGKWVIVCNSFKH